MRSLPHPRFARVKNPRKRIGMADAPKRAAADHATLTTL